MRINVAVVVVLLVMCFGLILGIWTCIAIPSKPRRQRFAAWVRKKLEDVKDSPLFCLLFVSCLVLRGDDD
jgi:hypothetical protein